MGCNNSSRTEVIYSLFEKGEKYKIKDIVDLMIAKEKDTSIVGSVKCCVQRLYERGSLSRVSTGVYKLAEDMCEDGAVNEENYSKSGILRGVNGVLSKLQPYLSISAINALESGDEQLMVNYKKYSTLNKLLNWCSGYLVGTESIATLKHLVGTLSD